MRITVTLLFIFLLLPSFLNAAYVQVAQTNNKNQLRVIKSKLDRLGLKMVFKKKGSKYVVYSGPYKNSKSTAYAYKKIKRYFPYAKVMKQKTKKQKSTTDKKEIALEDTLIPSKDAVQSKNTKMSGFYAGIGLGYSSSPSSHTTEAGNIDVIVPNNTGLNFTIDGGYHFENGLSLSMAYMKFNASDIVFDNMYGVVNYRFNAFGDFVPYFGFLAGYSSLVWNVDPIANAQTNSSNDSESFFAGSQTGIIYKGLDSIVILLGYQCMFMDHTTKITIDDASSKLQHETLHSMQLGIQYNF